MRSAFPSGDPGRAPRRGAAITALALGLVLAAPAGALSAWAGLSAAYLPKALAVFGAGVALVLATLPAGHPHARFGPANQVTLARLALAALLAGLLGERAAPLVAWVVVVVGACAAVLDALDGPLARRTRLASAFGARFDMETDAVLMLALATLAWQLGKAGPWILLAGLLRYLFVGAGRLRRWLERPLPPSTRRKTACVVQIVALVVCLAPIVPHPASAAVAGGALALLVYSFAADVAWLRRHARVPLLEAAR